MRQEILIPATDGLDVQGCLGSSDWVVLSFQRIEKHKPLGLNARAPATRNCGSIPGWFEPSDAPSNVE